MGGDVGSERISGAVFVSRTSEARKQRVERGERTKSRGTELIRVEY